MTILQPSTNSAKLPSAKPVLAIVYLSFLLDNILLTVVVPIVPVYLISVDGSRDHDTKSKVSLVNSTRLDELFLEENGRVGFLLSSKAVVQLLVNPLVGYAARYTGYTLPLFVGSVNLLTSTLLFAIGESYGSLFFARSLQGFASACIGVSGMCLVAEQCQTEGSRSKVMGVVLGSVALGVLLGYPFGSFLYDFVGKTAPFVGIAILTTFNIGCQLVYLDLKPPAETSGRPTSWSELMSDGLILLTVGAIWVSTSAMAVLEPCLPLWLLTTIKPEVG
ncbi:Synaptic vesicular amine [Nesidiocoris tenuis]|uniref:Synaptic vesicular amine n=1 Tax=Nesidiocoris tenuis TaxID=355587 RepID=A0ABN7AWI8_9HEMI|nr:Synaptic vesicular amine [Nesidiocoris tenuis]